MLFRLRFVALAFFAITDLGAKESAGDRAERECSCEPKAKAHHCSGAYQSARCDQPEASCRDSVKKITTVTKGELF